jgi:hypothetical protein
MSDRPLVDIEGLDVPFEEGPWVIDEDDMLLFAMLTDPVYMPELMWRDPGNRAYSGRYRVRDYQYLLNRVKDNYMIAAARGRWARPRARRSTPRSIRSPATRTC